VNAGNIFLTSLTIAWLALVLCIAGYAIGRNWGPLISPAPNSCAELAQICARRDGRIWLNKDGSAECTVSREERLP
jgi:hypothetical protein